MSLPFLNRSKEIGLLKSVYNEVDTKSHLIMVCGLRGTGKSELTNQFIDNHVRQPDLALKVTVNQKNKDYDAGHFIQLLGASLNDLSKKDNGVKSIESFLIGIKSIVLKERLFISLKNDFKKFIPGGDTIDEIFKKFFRSENYSSDRLLKSKNDEILRIIYDYIRQQLMGKRFVLKIENIQSIDELSLSMIKNLIGDTNRRMVIFEYTENESDSLELSRILSEFEDIDLRLKTLSVKPLELEEFRELFRSYPDLTFQLLKESFIYKQGNLRPLVDYFLKLKYDLDFKDQLQNDPNWLREDFTQFHLENLKRKSDLFVLTIVHAHNSEVDISLLRFLSQFDKSPEIFFDIEGSLHELSSERFKLIKRRGNLISVSHDHISSAIRRSDKTKHLLLIAYKYWLFVYEEKLVEDVFIARSERLLKILYFSSILGDQFKTLSYLGEISSEAVRSRAPEKLIGYVEEVKLDLIDKTFFNNDSLLNDINFWLVELYYKLSKSQKAWDTIKHIDGQFRKKTVLEGVLLEQIGKAQEAIEFSSQELSIVDEETNYTLALNLVKLVSYFDVGRFKECRSLFDKLIISETYQGLFEYGFLLRNAELVYSFKDSIPFYRESINHFKSFGADRQVAFSRIGLGVHLGLIGQLDEAEEEFRNAEMELNNSVSERHTILNNLAVVRIYKGIWENDTKQLLREALSSATLDFDRVAILSNYLAIMDWSKNKEEAQGIIISISRILISPSFSSLEIIRYAYFNIMKYYDYWEETTASKEYRDEILKLNLPITPIWSFWLDGKPMPSDDEEVFTATIDRAVSYLTHWNMEYDSSLMPY